MVWRMFLSESELTASSRATSAEFLKGAKPPLLHLHNGLAATYSQGHVRVA